MESVDLGLVAVAGLSVGTSHAATKDARLSGRFKVTAYGGGGKPVSRTYSFRPLCSVGICRKVALRREGGGGGHPTSTLKRVRRGAYRGTEHQKGTCLRGGTLEGEGEDRSEDHPRGEQQGTGDPR